MPVNVPSYPIVDVTVRDDGSAHVNVAGEHVDLPAGDLAATRRAIISQAQTVAAQLGRPVRMRATDPAGSWLQAVDTDGSVIDMTPVAGKKRPKPAARPVPAPSTNSTASTPTQTVIPAPAPLPAESTTQPAAAAHPTALPADVEHTVLAARRSVGAVLRFSTGEVVTVTGAMIIGRRPPPPMETARSSSRSMTRAARSPRHTLASRSPPQVSPSSTWVLATAHSVSRRARRPSSPPESPTPCMTAIASSSAK